MLMISGAHFLLYSKDPEADQQFLDDVLGTISVPAEPGRRIFALPPGEIATHPGGGEFVQQHAGHDLMGLVLYLVCGDLRSTVEALQARDTHCTEIEETEFGLKTTVILPSGGEIGLYQPSHQTAFDAG